MATLHRFKVLATQCAVAASPTRSPSASPVIHLRRKKTLRMLLFRAGSRRLPPQPSPPDRKERKSPENGEALMVSNKLKDLFVSSPPAPMGERSSENVREGLLAQSSAAGDIPRGIPRSLRPLSATLRQRLLRRAWRPALVGIPE